MDILTSSHSLTTSTATILPLTDPTTLEDVLCGCILEQLHITESQIIIELRGLRLAPPALPQEERLQLIYPGGRILSPMDAVQQLALLPDWRRQIDDIIAIGTYALFLGMTGGAWLLVETEGGMIAGNGGEAACALCFGLDVHTALLTNQPPSA